MVFLAMLSSNEERWKPTLEENIVALPVRAITRWGKGVAVEGFGCSFLCCLWYIVRLKYEEENLPDEKLRSSYPSIGLQNYYSFELKTY